MWGGVGVRACNFLGSSFFCLPNRGLAPKGLDYTHGFHAIPLSSFLLSVDSYEIELQNRISKIENRPLNFERPCAADHISCLVVRSTVHLEGLPACPEAKD